MHLSPKHIRRLQFRLRYVGNAKRIQWHMYNTHTHKIASLWEQFHFAVYMLWHIFHSTDNTTVVGEIGENSMEKIHNKRFWNDKNFRAFSISLHYQFGRWSKHFVISSTSFKKSLGIQSWRQIKDVKFFLSSLHIKPHIKVSSQRIQFRVYE